MKLDQSFYRMEALQMAPLLLGKRLVHICGGQRISGRIVETEAYAGVTDKACHAYGGRRTSRTETLYRIGGTSYVYFVYGCHFLFNVVAAGENNPQAVLIRALEPLEGISHMRMRRGEKMPYELLCAGPGRLCSALAITGEQNGLALWGEELFLEEGDPPAEIKITAGPRVGVEYAGQDATLPYRFALAGSRCISRKM